MGRERSYSDEQLSVVLADSKSWRGTLRQLGLASTSSAAMRSVRAQADRLGLDYRHFVGQRRWTEAQLRIAIAEASSWAGVSDALGVSGRSDLVLLQGHAARLRIDISHLMASSRVDTSDQFQPMVDHLDRAGPLLAAAWFTLCGNDVSWPLEPSRYDLLVATNGGILRVQVKTTTTRVGATWKVYLSTSSGGRRTYGPDEIDVFFIVDGDMNYYLIPVVAVGGLHAIHLRGYDRFRQDRMP